MMTFDVATMRQWIADMPDAALVAIEHVVASALASPEDARMFLIHARSEMHMRDLERL